ncbi:MAG: porphobilinogen synthase [Pseudomonadota bacterium]
MPHQFGTFPTTRLRRLRRTAALRNLNRETALHPGFFIQATILRENDDPAVIDGMSGIERQTIDQACALAVSAKSKRIGGLALFPYTKPSDRNSAGSAAFDPSNLMCRAAEAIKKAVPDVLLIGDVALDPYTDHGHDGLMDDSGTIINDETVEKLREQALVLARSGFDIVAPSDMMDGRIGEIRRFLDAQGCTETAILSYAVKYASAFYGPYRNAVGSSGVLKGDKATYQMDPANALEGLREAALDTQEGADMLMVKPGLPYLDMVTRVKESFGLPTVAFQVSGEYAMMRSAADAGALDFDRALMESLTCFRRAGADAVITYAAMKAADLLSY